MHLADAYGVNEFIRGDLERSAAFLENQTLHGSGSGSRHQLHLKNGSIGKDLDKRELSIIQHKYDSRIYGELSNSVLDPLIHQNASNSKSLHESQRSTDQPHHQSKKVPNPEKLMTSITSMIKRQLDQGLSEIISTQQKKFDQIVNLQQ